jgi:hypothetical protein
MGFDIRKRTGQSGETMSYRFRSSGSAKQKPSGEKRKSAVFTIAVMVVSLFTFLMGSVYGVSDDEQSEENSSITRLITFDANSGHPVFAQIVWDDGREYRLSEVGVAYPAPGAVHERIYAVTVECPVEASIQAAGRDALYQSFEPSYVIDEDGFRGSIDLIDVSSTPVYASLEEPVERQLIYPGRASADISDLPLSAMFYVSSDEYIGASCEKELYRFAVSTEVAFHGDDGRPESYTATVTYRGLQTRLIIAYYQVAGSYQGVVPAVNKMMCVQLIYQMVVLPKPEQIVEARPDQSAVLIPVVSEQLINPMPQNQIDPLLVTGAVLLVIAVLLPLLYFHLRPDARLVNVESDGGRKVLLAQRLTITSVVEDDNKIHRTASAVFTVPAGFILSAISPGCCLLLRGWRYRKTDVIEIRYRERLLLKATPAASLEVGKALISAVSEAIMDDRSEPEQSFEAA